MLLERTITQLDTGPMAPDAARQLAELGYMQWIAGLPGQCNYAKAAQGAYDKAAPFGQRSPAIAGFCALLQASIKAPLASLELTMPPRARRGGAGARRASRMPF